MIYTRHIKFCFVLGIGYWYDVYDPKKLGMGGYCHNFVLPFMRIQFGKLYSPIKK